MQKNLLVGVTFMLLAVVIAGCGRRGDPDFPSQIQSATPQQPQDTVQAEAESRTLDQDETLAGSPVKKP